MLAVGAETAGRDVGFDEGMHVGKPVITGQQFKGLGDTEVTSERVIMVLAQ